MKRSMLKKCVAFVLAGSMLIGSATVTASADGETSMLISTPQLKVEDPSETSCLSEITADSQVVSNVNLNVEKAPTFNTDNEDNVNGFNGAYTVIGSNDQEATNVENPFNMSNGNYPMLISFKVKVDGSLSNGDYNLVGKMNKEYGIQLKVNNGTYKIVAYCMQTSSQWPTFSKVLANPSDWTSVVVAFTGSTFWISTDGGATFDRNVDKAGSCALKNEGDYFSIGCNKGQQNDAIIPDDIYMADIEMYRSYIEAEGEETAETAKTLYTNLKTDGTKILDVHVGTPYTVENSAWYEGDTAEGNPVTMYEEGKTYTLQATLAANEGYVFGEESRPSTIKIGYFSAPATAVVDLSGEKMTVTCTYSGSDKLTGIETDYWDSEAAKGTLSTQNGEDVWLYQIKSVDSAEWENVPDTDFKANYLGGTWMQGGNDQGVGQANDKYGWSKINRTQITCNFTYSGRDLDYNAVAYAWKASANGYYCATLANPIGDADGFEMYVSHAGSEAPNSVGENLLEPSTYSVGQTIKSPIAKVKEGDIIRFVATKGWATGFEPVIEEVSVKKYADQYLQEMENLNTERYTESNVDIFEAAIAEFAQTLKDSAENETIIEAAIAEMESAYNKLTQLYTITYTRGDGIPQKQQDPYNTSVTVMIDDQNTTEDGDFVGWSLDEGGTIVSKEPTYQLYVAGDMTLNAVYGNSEELVAAAMITNKHVEKNEQNNGYNVQFVSQLVVPENYTLKEVGLVWQADKEIDTSTWTGNTAPAEGNPGGKVTVNKVSTSYQYSITINDVPEGYRIYGVAYALMIDAEGNPQLVFSENGYGDCGVWMQSE